MSKPRIAVIGAGKFGENHVRHLSVHPGVELVAVADPNPAVRAQFPTLPTLADYRELVGRIDCAVVAAPSSQHAEIGGVLLAAGIDVLMEKPIAEDSAGASRLIELAAVHGRILQIGHLERFNPAVEALAAKIKLPLFFEVHRLSAFSPRSLDIDVVLDLMVHDLDLLLAFTGQLPCAIHAAGIRVLSAKVDIANVRLEFPSGCVANLTASRVSTEQVRKLRLFQPHEYHSLDFAKQELFSIQAGGPGGFQFNHAAIAKCDALLSELNEFIDCVITRRQPRVDGAAGRQALHLALAIIAKIEEHARIVEATLAEHNRQPAK